MLNLSLSQNSSFEQACCKEKNTLYFILVLKNLYYRAGAVHVTVCYCLKMMWQTKDSMLTVKAICLEHGHLWIWHSQPLLGQGKEAVPAGNRMLSASMLFSGTSYEYGVEMMCLDEEDGENLAEKELGIVGPTQPGHVVIRGATAHDFEPLRKNCDGADGGGNTNQNMPQDDAFYRGRRENIYW